MCSLNDSNRLSLFCNFNVVLMSQCAYIQVASVYSVTALSILIVVTKNDFNSVCDELV